MPKIREEIVKIEVLDTSELQLVLASGGNASYLAHEVAVKLAKSPRPALGRKGSAPPIILNVCSR